MVTNHAFGLTGGEGPYRQFARSVVPVEHGVADIADEGRICQREQGMQCPEGVPGGECAVAPLALRHRGKGAVGATVLSVGVAHEVRRRHGVVECRVEEGAFVARATLHGYLFQCPAPDFRRCLAGLVEGCGGGNTCFSLKVADGTFYADLRDADGHHQRIGIGKLQLHDSADVSLRRFCGRLREARHEVRVAVGAPAFGNPVALHLVGCGLLHFHLADAVVGREQVRKVDDYAGCALAFRTEGVAVKTAMRRSSEVALNAVVEAYAVESGFGVLVLVAEGCGMHFVARGTPPVIVGTCEEPVETLAGGTEEHVSQVGASRTAQVGVTEAVEGGIGIVVACSGVPVSGARVGTQLHGTVGSGGSWKGVPMESGSNHGVHAFVGTAFIRTAVVVPASAQQQSCQQRQEG